MLRKQSSGIPIASNALARRLHDSRESLYRRVARRDGEQHLLLRVPCRAPGSRIRRSHNTRTADWRTRIRGLVPILSSGHGFASFAAKYCRLTDRIQRADSPVCIHCEPLAPLGLRARANPSIFRVSRTRIDRHYAVQDRARVVDEELWTEPRRCAVNRCHVRGSRGG